MQFGQKTTKPNQEREGDEELDRRRQPKPIAHRCPVLAQKQRRQTSRGREDGRLPKVIPQSRSEATRQRKETVRNHRLSPFSILFSIFSAYSTSSRVSLPAPMRWATTGRDSPANMASRSSTSLRCAALRETDALNTWKLPTLWTRRTTFFASIR